MRLRCAARTDLEELSCTLTVRGDYGPLFSMTSQPGRAGRGPLSLECRLRELPLLPGLYRVEADLRWAGSPAWAVPETVAAFRVTTDLAVFGSRSPVGATKSRGGFLLVPYAWRLESGDGVRELAGLHQPDGAPIIAGGRG